jgi:S1-C subfamily serine protease
MKIWLGVAFVLSLLPLSILAGYKDLPKAIQKADNSTVLICVDNQPAGSGLVVTRNNKYYVWTDAHVVDSCKIEKQVLGFKFQNFTKAKVVKKLLKDDEVISTLSVDGEIIAFDEKLDIALLELSGGDDKHFKNTKFYLEDKLLPRGTDIILVGNFLNFQTGTSGVTGASTGIIGGYGHKVDGQKFDIIHNGAVTGGCSGSGVFLEDGRCIGIVCRMWSTNTVLYSPIREIKKWAQINDLMWALEENK